MAANATGDDHGTGDGPPVHPPAHLPDGRSDRAASDRDQGNGTDARDTGDTEDAVPFVLDDDIATRVANARARHGRGGGMLAAGMLGLDQIVNGRKPREEAAVVVDASGQPTDIDRDGIRVRIESTDGGDGIEFAAPPLPPRAPVVPPSRGGRRRWR